MTLDDSDYLGGVPQHAIVDLLRLDKATVSRRVGVAVSAGYLVNLEQRKGMPHRLMPGEPMPIDKEVIPTSEDLRKEVMID